MKIFKTNKTIVAFAIGLAFASGSFAAPSPEAIVGELVNILPNSQLMLTGGWKAGGREGTLGTKLTGIVGFEKIDSETMSNAQLEAIMLVRKIKTTSSRDADRINLYLRPKGSRDGFQPDGVLFQLIVDSTRLGGNLEEKAMQTFQILAMAAKKAGLNYKYLVSASEWAANGQIRLKGADDFQRLLQEIDNVIAEIEVRGHSAVLGVLPDNVTNIAQAAEFMARDINVRSVNPTGW